MTVSMKRTIISGAEPVRSRKRTRHSTRRRLRFESLEGRMMLAACEGAVRELTGVDISPWHNPNQPTDVDDDGNLTPRDALYVINEINDGGIRPLAMPSTAEGETAPGGMMFVDVNDDRLLSPLDVIGVVNALNLQSLGGSPVITTDEVKTLLCRAAAASASDNAIIAVVDRGGHILGVRTESGVLADIPDDETLVFAIDGAVAKARTAAFFANDTAPLTSRTVRFVSQSTVTQRAVESNPNVKDPDSTVRGPGTVAPIGTGAHFPPGIMHTPPVDLFDIENTNRDSIWHAGEDAIKGTPDDILLPSRFNVDPVHIPAGQEIDAPESYGFASQRLPDAQARGISTLPGGIPLYKEGSLVGGIGVFFPGPDGYATHEQGFVAGVGQSELARTNAPQVLEAEWIAFAAAGGSSAAGATVGELEGVPPLAGYDIPFGRLDLVGITLEVIGPHPTTDNPRSGVDTIKRIGNSVGRGDPNDGANQAVGPGPDMMPGGGDDVFLVNGKEVPVGWLVMPHDSPLADGPTATEVEMMITQGIVEAERVRAAIRLKPDGRPGARTRMVFAVADQAGNVLGLYRMEDATFFSIEVAVSKARNTAYYASADIVTEDLVDADGDGTPDLPVGVAFTNRTFRFVAEPRFPDGVDGTPPAPMSILNDPGIDPATAENAGPPVPASAFTSVLGFTTFNPTRNFRDPDDIANQSGAVYFPGSAPIYVGDRLFGGIGVSGDGVDQDDVVTFAATVGFKPDDAVLRADDVFVLGVRLPYQKFLRNPYG